MLAQPGKFAWRMLLCGLINLAASVQCSAQNRPEDALNRDAAGFYSRQQWKESIERFQDLIDLFPNSSHAQLAPFYQGEANMQLEQFRQAYRDYQRYLVSQPQGEFASRARFRLGEAAYRNDDCENAVRLLSQFLNEYPQDPLVEFAWSYLGQARLTRMELPDAQHAFESALHRFPASDLAVQNRMGLAIVLELQGQITDAIRLYQFVTDSEDLEIVFKAHLRLGKLYFQEDRFSDAERHLEQVVDRAEDSFESILAEAVYWLARTTYQQGRNIKSLEWFKVGIDVEGTLATAVALRFDGAIVAKETDQSAVAVRWIDQLLRLDPASDLADDALYLKIELLTESPLNEAAVDISNAIAQFQETYPESPWRSSALAVAGRYFYNHQSFTTAKEIFLQLTSRDNDPRWRYFLALCLIGEEAFVEAEAELNKIDATATDENLNSLTQLAIATAKFGQKKYSVAIIGYQNYLRTIDSGDQWTIPSDDDGQFLTVRQARMELVICWAHSGLWQEVIKGFTYIKTNRDQNDDVPSVIALAELLVSIAQKQELPHVASPLWEFLFQHNPDHPGQAVYLSSLAWQSVDEEDDDSARDHFERLLQEFPQHQASAAAAMWLAKWEEEQGHLQQAAQRYQWVLTQFPESNYANISRLRRARALLETNEVAQYSDAASLLQAYLDDERATEARDEALFMQGWIHAHLEQVDKSQEFFRTLSQEFPNSKYAPDATLRLALQAFDDNDPTTSRQQLESILVHPNIPDSLQMKTKYLLGELAAKEKRWEDVDRFMQAIVSLEDMELSQRASYWLAESAFQQSQYQQAVQRFERLVGDMQEQQSLHQNQSEVIVFGSQTLPWLWMRLAQAQGRLEDWTSAAQTAQEGLDQHPSFSQKHELLFIIARDLEDRGLLTDARQMYQEVIDADASSGTETAAIAQWRIGEVFFHQEDFENALKAYYLVDSTYSYPRWRSTALLQAGKCQEHLRNWDQAERLYSRLFEQFPDSEHASDALHRLERLKRFVAGQITPLAPAKK